MTPAREGRKADGGPGRQMLTRVLMFLAGLALAAPRWPQVMLTPKTDFPTGAAPDSLPLGDLNGDGRADLATAKFSDDPVSVLLNTTGTLPFEFGPGDLRYRRGRAR